ncbi:phospholipase B1, membrane-associated [Strongylocentrotus purpuratus]|uniref:Phospholipase B1, membrane-associated n=1 Tax=Strongylocentrotus purpuratus TaxID=7668 RepID=A0A7M7TGB8_STRPU|nr:phospholipase B1, membrane-associated [Strongylocentrotus purpuratus]
MGTLPKYFLLVLLVSNGLLLTQCRSSNRTADYLLKIQKEFEKYSINSTEELLVSRNVDKVGSNFDCPASVSPTVPKSVHLLRPGDIKVVGAIGDSLTAAYAAGASSFSPLNFEYPGEAASIGGDKTLEEIITLPNIFRKYNSHLYGYSTGLSVPFTQPFNKRFNLAISGSYASEMPEQARNLVRSMKNDPTVDFENDWKFITVFIGGNDLCSGCLYVESSTEQYIKFLEKAIQILHDECPRTFVNVVGIMQAGQVMELQGPLICNLVTSAFCPCALGGTIPQHFVYLKAREYQRLLRTSIESGKYDDKDDFAAVYQSFLEDSEIPRLPNGDVDRSFFTPECFHLSQKGQAAQSTANWNNLFEPVGSKDTSYDTKETINCPSQDFPYLYTNVNSKPGFLAKIQISSVVDNQIPKTNTTSMSRQPSDHDINTILRRLP